MLCFEKRDNEGRKKQGRGKKEMLRITFISCRFPKKIPGVDFYKKNKNV